jgi:hypothetical protein
LPNKLYCLLNKALEPTTKSPGWMASIASKFTPIRKNEKAAIKKNLLPYLGKPIFEGELKDKRDLYDRRMDAVIFKVTFKGRIKQGLLATVIVPPSDFPFDTPHLDKESGNVTSFCDQTLKKTDNSNHINNIQKDIGTLDGHNIEIRELEWSWKIPEFAPRGEYKAIIGIWGITTNNSYKIELMQAFDDSFIVVDSDTPHFQQQEPFFD